MRACDESDNPKWRMQSERDAYAQAKIVRHLVAPPGVGAWTVMAWAEDASHPEHERAVTLALRAAKAAGVGWISPMERQRRGSRRK